MKKTYRILIGILAAVAVVALIVVLGGGTQNFSAKYAGVDLAMKGSGLDRQDTYEAYLTAHKDAANATRTVEVDLLAFDGDAEVREESEGKPTVYTPDGSTVTWRVNVDEPGFYNILLDYLTTDSRGVDIERQLKINGETPFSGASQLVLTRMWKDADAVIVNSCAVTEESEKKAAKLMRRIRRENPDAVILLAGCMTQTNPEKGEALGADIVCGNTGRSSVPDNSIG